MIATGQTTGLFALPRIYLASKSPRRRELLKQLGVQFEMLLFREQAGRGPDVNEDPLANETPRTYVERVARMKADVGWARLAQRSLRRQPVLAADTTVSIDGRILGKPADRDAAVEMLRALSGREHEVITTVAVQLDTRVESATSVSIVRFAQLAERDILAYVASGEPMDKAGAYGIQGLAQAFIPEIRGSYSGVVGLPLHETLELLRRFG
jgi:septum formation protein